MIGNFLLISCLRLPGRRAMTGLCENEGSGAPVLFQLLLPAGDRHKLRPSSTGSRLIIFFKGKDHEHFVDALFHHLHASFFPGPYLRRNIKYDADALLFGPLCYTQVEPGIIDQYQYIGFEGQNIFFAKSEIAEMVRSSSALP